MSKIELRYPNLRIAMEEVQKERSLEVGGHTWEKLVEQYGEAILFAEIASIVSRLEQMIWHAGPYANPINNVDRILDLCIDLGNFTEFLYLATIDRENRTAFLNTGKLRQEETTHDQEPG
jgi:hypothetical protein